MKLPKARHIFFNNLFSLVFSALRILLNKSANPFSGRAASFSVCLSSPWNMCRSPSPGHMQVVCSSSLWFCCGSFFFLPLLFLLFFFIFPFLEGDKLVYFWSALILGHSPSWVLPWCRISTGTHPQWQLEHPSPAQPCGTLLSFLGTQPPFIESADASSRKVKPNPWLSCPYWPSLRDCGFTHPCYRGGTQFPSNRCFS